MSDSTSDEVPSDTEGPEAVPQLPMFNWARIFCQKLGLDRLQGQLTGVKWLGSCTQVLAGTWTGVEYKTMVSRECDEMGDLQISEFTK